MIRNFALLIVILMISVCAYAEVVVIRPVVEANSIDTWITGYGAKLTNYGSHVLVYAGNAEGVDDEEFMEIYTKRGLIKFDMNSISLQLQPGQFVDVNSAKLYLYSCPLPDQTTDYVTFYGHRITTSWNELEVTMMNATTATAWTAGGEFDPVPATTALFLPATTGWVSFDDSGLAEEVESWINYPWTNNGLLLRCSEDSVQDAGAGPGIHCPTGHSMRFNVSLIATDEPFPSDTVGPLGMSSGKPVPMLLVDYTVRDAECADVWATGNGLTKDLNQDCVINFKDFSLLSEDWLRCYSPVDSNCQEIWPL